MDLTKRPGDEVGAVCAYDYDAQKWVHGADAIPLLIAQIDADLSLLKSKEGPQYLRMISRRKDDIKSVIRKLERQRAELEGKLEHAD